MSLRKFKTVAAVATAALLLGGLGACSSARDNKGGDSTASTGQTVAASDVTVGVAMPTRSLERWNKDGSQLESLLKDEGYKVDLQYADNKVDQQVTQLQNMVNQGAKVLVVASIDGKALGPVLQQAKDKGAKVIAYDRLIKDPNISGYLSFDNTEVGRNEADGVMKWLDKNFDFSKGPAKVMMMGGSPTDNNAILVRGGQEEVVKPYIDAGKVKIVADQWVDNWDAANALKIMENTLTAQKNQIDAVVASNDGTALGALQALKAQGLAGKVPISGQDATADGCNSIAKGEQTVTVLKLGELWAIPIMLRLALIENLRRVAARITADRITRNLADHWADRMKETAEKDPTNLILVIADMARSNPPIVSSFVAEFTRRLQGQSPALALPLTWIEQRLAESGLTIEQSVHSENQQQAADQVSMSNSIGSLRFLGTMDWREFVERMSVVEQVLHEDSGAVYGRMDFATRDRYRHAVEKIAKRSRLSEGEVARTAIEFARKTAALNDGNQGVDNRTSHVGYYLIDKGLPHLERAVEVRRSASASLQKIGRAFPLLLYLGTITLITGIIGGLLIAKAHAVGFHDWHLVLLCILSLLCASQLSVALVNWLATLLTTPHPLPRMDFSKGIPPESRTLAVVPTMLMSAQNIEDLIEALEVRFLANRDENLHFGLLTDFRDAAEEILPEDEPLVQLARKRIEDLNEKYGNAKGDAFFLFHRPRRWNPREQVWMGYERKRGKLADLNSLLRGGAHGRFSLVVGDAAVLLNVKYVITLDTDTQLPRDSARQFVGAMAHPLNRAHYDEARQRIVAGYGILQPRVAVSLPSTNRSRYARMCGSEAGIDPYTRAVSDVYQDLFHEGSFIGKGIYDVDALKGALDGRFPENRILSHDLLEGCYARSGLLSDVMVYEEYPSRYSADVSRRHRWIRGDWQIASWLLSLVPGPEKRRQRNPDRGMPAIQLDSRCLIVRTSSAARPDAGKRVHGLSRHGQCNVCPAGFVL